MKNCEFCNRWRRGSDFFGYKTNVKRLHMCVVCRADERRTAKRIADRERRRLRGPSDYTHYLDSKPMRDYFNTLPYSHAELARRIGVNESQVRKLRNGKHARIRITTADRYLFALDKMLWEVYPEE